MLEYEKLAGRELLAVDVVAVFARWAFPGEVEVVAALALGFDTL